MLASARRRDLRELLRQCTAEGLDTLGEDVSKALVYHACQLRRIREQEFPYHYEDFLDGLSEMLGEGARLIEELIMERIRSRLQELHLSKGDWNLREIVKLLDEIDRKGS